MSILSGHIVPSSFFSWDKQSKMLACEISTIEGNIPGFGMMRIYDDAADVGFSIRSDKTGEVVTFHHSDTVIKEGDVMHWTFKPIPEHVRKNPKLEQVTVTIFND